MIIYRGVTSGWKQMASIKFAVRFEVKIEASTSIKSIAKFLCNVSFACRRNSKKYFVIYVVEFDEIIEKSFFLETFQDSDSTTWHVSGHSWTRKSYAEEVFVSPCCKLKNTVAFNLIAFFSSSRSRREIKLAQMERLLILHNQNLFSCSIWNSSFGWNRLRSFS